MTEVFVSTDDVKVIGGTANVNVEVDFGPQGDRGNLFLVGYGDPNTITHSTTLQVLDLYINVRTTDDDYLVIYQLQNINGTDTWVETSKLITDKFSVNRTVSFTAGAATDSIDFKISNIVPLSLLSGLTESNFNIQCTFSNPTKPIAHSIVVRPITVQAATGDIILPVGINAAEFSGSAWSPISGTHVVHFLITVV
jgi:hypothetical protein